jgi:hypothetical protein
LDKEHTQHSDYNKTITAAFYVLDYIRMAPSITLLAFIGVAAVAWSGVKAQESRKHSLSLGCICVYVCVYIY